MSKFYTNEETGAATVTPEDGDVSAIMKGNAADKAADYANYFCSYSYLYHQKQMLMDHVRMRAYHSAIMNNKHLFAGKTVLDCGTGSGVLSIWAAQAGAAKVYACEFTDMAVHARNLVEKNGLSDIIEVIQSSVEDLQLPCKVDIIGESTRPSSSYFYRPHPHRIFSLPFSSQSPSGWATSSSERACWTL